MSKNYFIGLLSFVLLIWMINIGTSQTCVLQVNVEQRIENSEFILEGMVTEQVSSWDLDYGAIYTIHKIAVNTKVKGELQGDTIMLVTRGGQVGTKMQVDDPELRLSIGDRGLFFLFASNLQLVESLKSNVLFQTEYNVLGFIQYSKDNLSASDALNKYTDIQKDIYSVFNRQGYIADFGYDTTNNSTNSGDRLLTISTFSPGLVYAGNQTQITVSGTGFGSIQGAGYVAFANADDGGGSFILPLASQYVSWSDSEIVLEVPTRAGSGSILVANDDDDSSISGTELYVNYNLSNVIYSGDAYPINLVDADGSGGLEFEFQEDFYNNNDAFNSFIRALNTWRCSNEGGTGIYLVDGGSSTIDVISNDEVNIVRFDNGSELSSNILGRATSYYSGCGGASINWYLEETDIVFNDTPGSGGFFWNFNGADNSTAGNEYDFESVAVHELGHSHQLGHVNNNGKIMYYSLSNGTESRELDQSDIDGGEDVLNSSQGVCSQSDMSSDYICSILPLESLLVNAELNNAGYVDVNFEVTASEDLNKIKLMKSMDGFEFVGIYEYVKPDHIITDYHFTDVQPYQENYYQVQTTDEDGLETFSEVIRVKLNTYENKALIYPNPVRDRLHISESLQNDLKQIWIKDLNGRILFEQKGPVQEILDLTALPLGPFIFEYYSASSGMQSAMILKQ